MYKQLYTKRLDCSDMESLELTAYLETFQVWYSSYYLADEIVGNWDSPSCILLPQWIWWHCQHIPLNEGLDSS